MLGPTFPARSLCIDLVMMVVLFLDESAQNEVKKEKKEKKRRRKHLGDDLVGSSSRSTTGTSTPIGADNPSGETSSILTGRVAG